MRSIQQVVISLLTLICLQPVLVVGQTPDSSGTTDAADATDVPVMYYLSFGTKSIPPANVKIWQDGRIVWKDKSQYFEARISEEEVATFLEKVALRYELSPIKRAPRRACSSYKYAIYELTYGSATICTPQISSYERWLASFWEHSRAIGEKMKEMPSLEFIDFVKKNMEEDKGIYDEILVNYRKMYRLDESKPYADNEIYWLIRQFVDDGEFFVWLGEAVGEMIPTDENTTVKEIADTRSVKSSEQSSRPLSQRPVRRCRWF